MALGMKYVHQMDGYTSIPDLDSYSSKCCIDSRHEMRKINRVDNGKNWVRMRIILKKNITIFGIFSGFNPDSFPWQSVIISGTTVSEMSS